jgi:hypothetical protein
VFSAEDRKGRYVYFGIREHGMAAAMNGLALHGGIRPYSGTFMCFTDYARPAMRLSALMGLPVGWVMPSCKSPVTIAPTSCGCLATELCQPPQSEPSEFSLAS